MSELKYQLMLNKDMSWVPCYLKSEADKVIAEKDEEITELKESHKNEVKQLLILNSEQANAAYRLRDSMEQVIFHQKYKRCLAMARWCERKRIDAANYRIPRQKLEFYEKWRKRWLALAEKFKEAK